jgi:hypothetical protein
MTETRQDKRASSSSPPAGTKLDPDTPIETTEQLRIAIDQGGGGKVDATDPAAAPLGTDDDSSGAAGGFSRDQTEPQEATDFGDWERVVAYWVFRVYWRVDYRLCSLAKILEGRRFDSNERASCIDF